MKKVKTVPEADKLAENYSPFMESSETKDWIERNKNSKTMQEFAKEYIVFLQKLMQLL